MGVSTRLGARLLVIPVSTTNVLTYTFTERLVILGYSMVVTTDGTGGTRTPFIRLRDPGGIFRVQYTTSDGTIGPTASQTWYGSGVPVNQTTVILPFQVGAMSFVSTTVEPGWTLLAQSVSAGGTGDRFQVFLDVAA
jgi:hypothetical protein